MDAIVEKPTAGLGLPAAVERVLDELLDECRRVFAERLVSAVLFGSAAEGRLRATSDVNLLFLLTEYVEKDVSDLAKTLRIARAIIRVEPIFLIESELPQAMEMFGVKFADIIRRHRVLVGQDPFADMHPSRAAEIYRIKQVLLNLSLRMRAGFAERAGQEDRVAMLMAEAAGPMRACAAAMIRLDDAGTFAPKEALERLVNAYGRVELRNALADLSRIREREAPIKGDLTPSFFLILEIIERLRARAWRME